MPLLITAVQEGLHSMKSDEGTSVPSNLPAVSATRTPSKPTQTSVPLEALVQHYNAQLPAYQEALKTVSPLATATEMKPIELGEGRPPVTKEEVIELIRKQNFRLKRFIRARSIELLQQVVRVNEDNRTVGYPYDEILNLLAVEFPESSTSAACLRWYVVHLWSEADEEGLERPKMPQFRPRSKSKSKKSASGAEPAPLA